MKSCQLIQYNLLKFIKQKKSYEIKLIMIYFEQHQNTFTNMYK